MFNHQQEHEERLFSRRRVRTFLIGTIIVLVVGFLAVNTYTYFQYGGTMLDGVFGAKDKQSPAIGKLAYEKERGFYIGVIRGEGRSKASSNQIYYVEQPGGAVIEISKDRVEVRNPPQR